MRKIPLILLGCFALAGCNPEQRIVLPEATLTGTITYKGKAVPHAMLVVAGDAQAAQGFADEYGRFSIKNCPSGTVKIGINSEAGRGNMMGTMMSAKMSGNKDQKPAFVDVPKKYFDPSTSGVVTQVNDPKGTTNYDIKLN